MRNYVSNDVPPSKIGLTVTTLCANIQVITLYFLFESACYVGKLI